MIGRGLALGAGGGRLGRMMTPPPSGFEFRFERDTFAYRNELVWEYGPAPAGRGMAAHRREPPPEYAHRCFVMVRMARQFFLHARFLADETAVDEAACRRLIIAVRRRTAVRSCPQAQRVVIRGWPGLRAFSRDREPLLKAACGGAWRSYVLPSHWRMVFPISRAHQARQAAGLVKTLREGGLPIVHLVRFPQLTINHGLLLFGVESAGNGGAPVAGQPAGDLRFRAYDPNQPEAPVALTYHAGDRTFRFPANPYWTGGRVDVIHVLRSRWF